MLTLTYILTEASSRLWDPLKQRYTEADIIRWLNYTLDDVQTVCKFQKKLASVLGSTYVATLGTDPKYYQLPTDFLGLDKNFGIRVNGLRRLPTTDSEVDMFQEKGISQSMLEDTATGTVYVDDYFSESYTGLIMHYALDFVLETEVSAGRSGKLMWFTPSAADTDTIEYQYYMLPDQYASGSANYAHMVRNTSEVLILGIVCRAMQKAFFAGETDKSRLDAALALYEKGKQDVGDFYLDSEKPTDKVHKIRTARQVYGMYNSAHRRGGSWPND